MTLPPQLQQFFRHAALQRYKPMGQPRWGGMGAVVQVFDSSLNKQLAMKILCTNAQNSAERFQREIQALINLRNPHIVEIIDFGMAGSDFYYLMDWIEGQSLEALVLESFRVTGQSLAPELIQSIFSHLAETLEYCHSQGIIHRDLKPENIMVTKDEQVLLIDFGLVRTVQNSLQASQESVVYDLTRTGEFLGTPQYMSPEQVDFKGDSGPISAKTDVWALGATLHFVLTGQPPFNCPSAPETYISILDRDIDEGLLPQDPDYQALNAACLESLEKKQEQRPNLDRFRDLISSDFSEKKSLIVYSIAFASLIILLLIGIAFIGESFFVPPPLEFSGLDKNPKVTRESSIQLTGRINGATIPISAEGWKGFSDENGDFKIRVQLDKEGMNRIKFIAQVEQRAISSTIEVHRDTIGPTIRLPIDKIGADTSKIIYVKSSLKGVVIDKHDIVKFTINNRIVKLTRGSFKYAVENKIKAQVLVLVAEDVVGNKTSLKCKVYTSRAQLFQEFNKKDRGKLLDYVDFRAKSPEEKSAFLALANNNLWVKSPESIQDRAISIVGARLSNDFQFIETKKRKCGPFNARIATFKHKKTGIEFQLIPGRLNKRISWRDPFFEYTLKYLEILASEDCNQTLIAMALSLTPSFDFANEFLRFMGRRGTRSGTLNFMQAFGLARQIKTSDLPRYRSWFKQRMKLKIQEKINKEITEYIPPFLIGKRELSLGQWKTTAKLPDPPQGFTGSTSSWSKDPDYPMYCAHAIGIQWLKKADPRFRLPNRFEWAIAAQGGSDKRFFWGDDITKMEKYALVSTGGFPSPNVTTAHNKEVNAYGLSDVYGNVSEWVDPAWSSWREIWPRAKPTVNIFKGFGSDNPLEWGLSMGGYSYTPAALCQASMIFPQPILNKNPPYVQRIGMRVSLSIP